jgi:hypothetical protein
MSHLRFFRDSLSHSSFTIYSISHSWKVIVFEEFQKESHKKFDMNSEWIEMIVFTIRSTRNKHFSHERRMISCMKENIHSREWQSSSSRCLLVSNANTQCHLSFKWLNQKIHHQRKIQRIKRAIHSKEKFNKKMSFKFNEFIV